MRSSRRSQPTAPTASSESRATPPWLADSPRLQALVAGPDGAEILAELLRMVERQQARAPRYGKPLLARLRVDGSEAVEVAVLRDISASGVRLQLPNSAQLDVLSARNVWIEARTPGHAPLVLGASLVRVAGHRENGPELAFQFSAESQQDPKLHALLARLAAERAASDPHQSSAPEEP